MGVSENIETVKNIYAAFGRGDVPAILESLSPEVEWEFACSDIKAKIPWFVPGRGREAAMTFFQRAGAELRWDSFEVLSLMGEGEWVVGLCRIDAVNAKTGRRLTEGCEPHVWRFDGQGRVVAMRHAADTYHHAEAAGLV